MTTELAWSFWLPLSSGHRACVESPVGDLGGLPLPKKLGATGKGPDSWTQIKAPASADRKRKAINLVLLRAKEGMLQNHRRSLDLACPHCLSGPLLNMRRTNGKQPSSGVFSSPTLEPPT
jgi:hypothetical protein